MIGELFIQDEKIGEVDFKIIAESIKITAYYIYRRRRWNAGFEHDLTMLK